MDNKSRELFVTMQSKGCKFMPKMRQNTFGGRASCGPAGETPVQTPVAAMAKGREGRRETAAEERGPVRG